MQSTKVAISVTEGGTFLASSSSSPYFCFEAATEEEVVAITRRALAFHQEFHVGDATMVVERPAPRVGRSRKIRDEVFTPVAA